MFISGLRKLKTEESAHAVRTQAPPASLILFSAILENTLAFTMTGILGRIPLPSTLK